jgi:hypothetical protein
MSCRIGPNAKLEQGVFGGQHSSSFEEANFSPGQGKHRWHTPFICFSLYNLYFMFMIVHLRVGVLWNLVALWTPLQVTLFTHLKDVSIVCYA